MRLVSALTAIALLGVLPAVIVPGIGGAQPPSGWCSSGAAEPCVESADVDGVPVTDGDPLYDIVLVPAASGGSSSFLWNVVPTSGGFDLGAPALPQQWTVTFRTGALVPRVSFTRGEPGTVARTEAPNTITVNSQPTTVTGGCDLATWPWSCPHTATEQWDAYLGGEVTDYGSWTDVAQRDAMYGYDIFTNVDGTSLPAEIQRDAATGEERLAIRMANSHFLIDGVTAVKGFMHQRIPNRFLRETYGIDNPATLTARGLDPVLRGSGTGTVTVTDVGPALVVDAVDMSFTSRVLRLNRGVITPRRPQNVSADRHRVHRARIEFDEGTARGSRVVRHQVRCRAIGDDHRVTKSSRRTDRIVVRRLHADQAYWCRVRAVARAGPGTWSSRVRVVARP